MSKVSPVLEKAARALAGRHYAHKFGQPEEHPMVSQNVEANWSDFTADAHAVVSLLAASVEDVVTAIKPAKERQEFADQWATVFGSILV